VSKAQVVNLSNNPTVQYVYIGRPNPRRRLRGHPLANPYVMRGKDTPEERQKCLAYYRKWLRGESPTFKGPADLEVQLRELKRLTDQGYALACWCHPLPCHGDVLAELIEALLPETGTDGPAAPDSKPGKAAGKLAVERSGANAGEERGDQGEEEHQETKRRVNDDRHGTQEIPDARLPIHEYARPS